MVKYKVAGVVFTTNVKYEYTKFLLKDYVYNGNAPADLIANVIKEDIDYELSLSPDFTPEMVENIAVFRKLNDYLLERGEGIVFHASAIAVDGNAYLFTAPSGTGKSTHTRLWREYLGERAVMINDDKPILKIEKDGVYAYGNPWTGKHFIGNDIKVKVKAICSIYRSKENQIRKTKSSELLFTALNQTERPSDEQRMDAFLGVLGKILEQVEGYALGCNISLQAAELAFKTMSKGN